MAGDLQREMQEPSRGAHPWRQLLPMDEDAHFGVASLEDERMPYMGAWRMISVMALR